MAASQSIFIAAELLLSRGRQETTCDIDPAFKELLWDRSVQ